MWPGIHLAHNSAKLKILQSAETYPVVKVRPCGLDKIALARPAVRWSVGIPTDQGNDENKTAMAVGTCRTVVDANRPFNPPGPLVPLFNFLLVPGGLTTPLPATRLVETRRLELLTLSLQRRCSAN